MCFVNYEYEAPAMKIRYVTRECDCELDRDSREGITCSDLDLVGQMGLHAGLHNIQVGQCR